MMQAYYKAGQSLKLHERHAAMGYVPWVVVEAAREVGIQGAVVHTSATRPRGKVLRLHELGRADDFDAVELAEDSPLWHAWKAEVKRRLGGNYDVIARAVSGGRMHIHVEYDPK